MHFVNMPFLMCIFRFTTNYILLKYRCLYYCYVGLTHIYLKLIIPPIVNVWAFEVCIKTIQFFQGGGGGGLIN